ncbi:MAG: hypothetical protein JWM11_1629 [Planctomycetaceae bacterium]|nr:hypothetical protein [Planctomycetaceae bacterium]
MALPSLNAEGDLPPGIHLASLTEIQTAFGASTRARENIFQRLAKILNIALSTGHLARFVVFGSFVTDKPNPKDVDIFMVFDETFDATSCRGETLLLLDHSMADTHFGASIFWIRRPAAFGGEQATIEFWQTKRNGALRGIVEIVE